MNRRSRRWPDALAAVGTCLAIAATACGGHPGTRRAAFPAPVRIMLVGDSITQGSTGDFTWRYRLWQHLRDDGVDVRFVGPMHDLWDDLGTSFPGAGQNLYYAVPAFATDPDANAHDATVGAQLQSVAPGIGAVVRAYRPDYVIVLLGINDLTAGAPPAAIAAQLRVLIAGARSAVPGVRFDLLELLPAVPVAAATLSQVNGLVGALGAQSGTKASPVAVTAPPTGYSASLTSCTDTWDGIHPNARGELKIAAAVADTLHAAFKLGAAYPYPLPGAAVGPQPAPVLSAVPAGTTTRLAWTPALGATAYLIWRRPLGRPWPRRATLRVPGTGTTISDRAPQGGQGYQYLVQPAKGTCVGDPSAVVSVAAKRK